MMHILRYTKSSHYRGLLFDDKSHIQVIDYVDANWVDCPSDRRSTFAIVFWLEAIWFLRRVKNSMLLLDLAQKAKYGAISYM